MEDNYIWPSNRSKQPRSVALSILDASVARYSPTGGIWVYKSLPSGFNDQLAFAQHLKKSLSEILNMFPQWTGQLHWAPLRPDGTHTERFNRPMITWGKDSDPGVEWKISRHASSAADIVPDAASRASGDAVWIGDEFPQQELVSGTKLPMQTLNEYEGLSGMHIQVTLLSAGGFAIGIKMAHALADAQSLIVFMNAWAAVSQGLAGHPSSLSSITPIFDPSLLDATASGDIDSKNQDESLVGISRGLPRSRFDWWATDAPGYPRVMDNNTNASKPSDEKLLAKALESPAIPAPWTTWDMAAPVKYALVHFTGDELTQLRDRATGTGQRGSSKSPSRLDAVLAHMWQLINRARFANKPLPEAPDEQDVFIHLTLGARTRVSPLLAESFLGSPLFQGYVKAAASDFVTEEPLPVDKIASQIRQTTAHTFTPTAVGALLHELAHEVAPQRIWAAFLGRHHTLVTSWLRLRPYDVFFGADETGPQYVHAVLPKMDGCIQIMDSGCADGGMDLAVYLEESVADTVLRDGTMRPWKA